MRAEQLQRIREKFEKYAQSGKIPAYTACIISGDHDLQFSGGTFPGQRGEPFNPDTLFAIGSLSKPLTATLFAILHEKGIIDPSKSLLYYLEKRYTVHSIFECIKIVDVLTHHSGLPRIPSGFFSRMDNMNDPYASLNRDDLASFLKTPEELEKPGKYRYSNIGYMLLGEVLKVEMDRSFDEIAGEYLLQEAGMYRTGTLEKFNTDTNKATGHNSKNRTTPHWTGELLDGAGSLYSTNHDMRAFLELQLNDGDNLISTAVKATHTVIKGRMGMGWHHKAGWFSGLMGYKGFIWHNGMTGGFSSFMAFHKQKKTGMFVLANKAISIDHWFYYYASFAR